MEQYLDHLDDTFNKLIGKNEDSLHGMYSQKLIAGFGELQSNTAKLSLKEIEDLEGQVNGFLDEYKKFSKENN